MEGRLLDMDSAFESNSMGQKRKQPLPYLDLSLRRFFALQVRGRNRLPFHAEDGHSKRDGKPPPAVEENQGKAQLTRHLFEELPSAGQAFPRPTVKELRITE